VKDLCNRLINAFLCVLFADFLVFQDYFRSLGLMSFPISIRLIMVRWGFRTLVSEYFKMNACCWSK
jgi:hypothetical protein